LLIGDADDRIVFGEFVVVVRDERRDIVEQLFSQRDQFVADAAKVARPDFEFTCCKVVGRSPWSWRRSAFR